MGSEMCIRDSSSADDSSVLITIYYNVLCIIDENVLMNHKLRDTLEITTLVAIFMVSVVSITGIS